MADKLTQLRSLYSKMPDGDAKKAVATKIAKLEASQPKEVVEVKEEVKETITKPKATKSASGKDKRHVFEKQVEGGKEVKVVMASSADLAKEAMQESGFEFVKTITRGRSPKEGFIPSGKVKKTKGTKRASKATRDDMAKEAGMTPEKAEKVSEKVAKAKKRGRKPMDKQAYLFEMPLKTQAGKVKRKVVTATSEASAQKSAGKNYTLVKELKAGENPKVGVQAVEGFVAPEPKKRGRKPKAKTLEEVTEKSEDIGEGIAIADKTMRGSLEGVYEALDTLNGEIGKMQREVARIQGEVTMLMSAKKTAPEGKTSSEPFPDSKSKSRLKEKRAMRKVLDETFDHLDRAGIDMDDLGGVTSHKGGFYWFDSKANAVFRGAFSSELEAHEDFLKHLKNTYPEGKKMAHGGKTQGYDDKLDESLGSRKGAERTKEQSRKDRRDESAAMEKSMGRRKYSSVGTMDIEDRML